MTGLLVLLAALFCLLVGLNVWLLLDRRVTISKGTPLVVYIESSGKATHETCDDDHQLRRMKSLVRAHLAIDRDYLKSTTAL